MFFEAGMQALMFEACPCFKGSGVFLEGLNAFVWVRAFLGSA